MEPNPFVDKYLIDLNNAILAFREAFFTHACHNLFQPKAAQTNSEYMTFRFPSNCGTLANQQLLINPTSGYIIGIYINNKPYLFEPKLNPSFNISAHSTFFKTPPVTRTPLGKILLNPQQQSKTATKQSLKTSTKDYNFLPINLSYRCFTNEKVDLHTFNKAMVQLFGDLSIDTTKQQLFFEILLLFVIEPARN